MNIQYKFYRAEPCSGTRFVKKILQRQESSGTSMFGLYCFVDTYFKDNISHQVTFIIEVKSHVEMLLIPKFNTGKYDWMTHMPL